MIHLSVTAATIRMPSPLSQEVLLYPGEVHVETTVAACTLNKPGLLPTTGTDLIQSPNPLAGMKTTNPVTAIVDPGMEKDGTKKDEPKRSVTFVRSQQRNWIAEWMTKVMTLAPRMFKKTRIDPSLEEKVTNAIDVTFPDKFLYADIFGYNNVKVYLERAILGQHGLRRCMRILKHYSNIRNILLYGKDVGILKQIATSVAKSINIPLVAVTASKLHSKNSAEAIQMLHNVFHYASTLQPCILYFANADFFCGPFKDLQAQEVKTEFCNQLDSSIVFNRGVFVIVATNEPWRLNQKLMLRFQDEIFVDFPGRPYGRQMKTFRMENDPNYTSAGENYYSLLDVFPCLSMSSNNEV